MYVSGTTTLRMLAETDGYQTGLCARQGQLLVVKEASGEAAQRLDLEAQALSRLSDVQGLPRLLAHEPGRMQRSYLPGLTLQQLRLDRTLPKRQIRFWLRQLEELLGEIHARGAWHGDVCPANTLIRPDGGVALLDWGAPDWGTPPYRRPELTGPEADRFSLRQMCEELLGQAQTGAGQSRPMLVGRESELEQLGRAWSDCAFQESTWIGVSAPSGGGKTALLRELLWQAPFYAWGQGSTLTTPVSYVLFQSLWENSGWRLDEAHSEGPEWRQFLRTFAHQSFPDGEPPPTFSPILLAEAWHALLTRLAEAQPLLLIFDDIQWCDEADQRLLEMLSSRPLPGVMVVLAWRSQEFEPTSRLRLTRRIELGPLGAEHVRQWARQEEVELADAQILRVVDWTRGCPLLIAELLRHPDQLSFSGRVGSILKDRLASADAATLTILRRAALMGTAFQREPLGDSQAVGRALAWAQEQQLMLPNWRFSHDQVREALLDGMDPVEKQDEHRELALYYQDCPSRVHACAFHFAQANEEKRAYPYALQAARLDRERGLFSSSVYFYRIFCRNNLDFSVLEEFCAVLDVMGAHDEAVESVAAALPRLSCEQMPGALVLLAVHHNGAGRHGEARALCRQTWRVFRKAAPSQRAEIQARILNVEQQICRTRSDLLATFTSLIWRLPWVVGAIVKDPVFLANTVLVTSYIAPRLHMRRQRLFLLGQTFRRLDRMTWTRVLARLVTFHLRNRDSRFAERMLKHVVREFESLGSPWELGIVLLQLGYLAAARGHFAELRQTIHKLHQLADLCGHLGFRDVAINFETIACGARLSYHRYADPPAPSSEYYFWFHRWVGVTQFLLRRGRPLQALQRLPRRQSPIPFENAMVATWKATALRQAGDQTPRRWVRKRREFYRQALEQIDAAFRWRGWERLFQFQLRREKGLLLLRLGRCQEGTGELRRSIDEAQEFGASYEEALSRQAWARAELAGAEAEQERARQLFESIGAFWELSESAAVGLPLQEIGEAARDYLLNPNAATQTEMERWAAPAWCAQLVGVVAASQQAEAELAESLRLLEQRNARWETFLNYGPVSISHFASDGRCLQGQENNPGQSLQLENGERLVFHMPLSYEDLPLLTALIQAEQTQQNQRLNWLRQAFPGVVRLLNDLTEPQLNLPDALVALPWNQLERKARLALCWIYQESQRNLRKHRAQSRPTIDSQIEGGWLWVHLGASGPGASGKPSQRRSFGLESMRFRASLAGGRLQVHDDFQLTLRLPLQVRSNRPGSN